MRPSSTPYTSEHIHVPCDACPWLTSNHGKKHRFGFYTKTNLTRLWNQIRKGGSPQSCHVTDPSHPDHVACGAKPGSKPKECAGSVILVKREIEKLLEYAKDGAIIEPETCDAYLAARKKGLSKKGLLYWLVNRIQLANIPLLGGQPLPPVDISDERISLPTYLEG